MRHFKITIAALLGVVLCAIAGLAPAAGHFSEAGFYAAAANLTPSQQAGREIWYKATAGNGRFHTYVYQQRLGVLIDWYRVLRADQRDARFATWGLINDPGCCTPGSDGCPAKSLEETYGLDWCPGDDELLAHVGKTGYRDPACDFAFADAKAEFVHGHDASMRQSSCDLAFGTSTGAMGLRKFPNPKFDERAWRKLNDGRLDTWQGYNRLFETPGGKPQIDALGYEVRRLKDASVEPPFLVGMACGACHIAFDPLNPPADPAHPEWQNLAGLVGNQYARVSEVMASGMPENTLEWQMFSHTRPGTVDTSAVPNDQVNNPGTMNALINVAQRPAHFLHDIPKWRATASCSADDEQSGTCWCDGAATGKCWQKAVRTEAVHQILKGGGDSIGAAEAVQRVYVNIGMCAEQCWVNHLTDLRQLDPEQRGFGQTPFDIGQCRRDCPNFRAIEDRLGNVVDFLMSAEGNSTPLYKARGLASRDELVTQLESEFGAPVVRGKQVFADNCARCHSFVPNREGSDPANLVATAEQFLNHDPFAPDPVTGLRANWLGNDEVTPASEVGTYRCRALHSNHMDGHVWEEYASDTHRARPPDTALGDPTGGSRGYYRNPSLVDLWAHAPFMHNNAIGPELCGKPGATRRGGQRVDFYSSPYVEYEDANDNDQLDDDEQFWRMESPPACYAYDPSVEGRYRLFKASVDSLLNPGKRIPKVTMLNTTITLDIGPKVQDDDNPLQLVGVRLVIPRDTSAGMFGSFQHKEFFSDLVLSKTNPEKLHAQLEAGPRPEKARQDAQMLASLRDRILASPGQIYDLTSEHGDALLSLYSTCRAKAENNGHRFGESLSTDDKNALTAFLATL